MEDSVHIPVNGTRLSENFNEEPNLHSTGKN